MSFEVREFVPNPEDPELQETYDIVNDLVDKAGDVTIRDLFTKDPKEFEPGAWDAIQRAKGVGFLQMTNKACCRNGICQSGGDGWCSRTPSGKCSAASDPCKS